MSAGEKDLMGLNFWQVASLCNATQEPYMCIYGIILDILKLDQSFIHQKKTKNTLYPQEVLCWTGLLLNVSIWSNLHDVPQWLVILLPVLPVAYT